jgi:hypothetical protein
MTIDTRIGLAGLIVAFLGIAITVFCPDKRWVGGICLVAAGVLLIGWGVREITHRPGSAGEGAAVRFPQSVRVKYSSRQVLQMSNVPGDYNQVLNLDNVAALYLLAPLSREAVTLLWPTLPIVTVAEPKADEQYKVPGGGTVQVPQAGRGLEMRGLTLMGGQAQTIAFDLDEHHIRLVRVGERIFRISLESIHDKADADRSMFLEFEFAISEEDNNAENLAAAITQVPQKPPQPDHQEVPDLLTAMDSVPIGAVSFRVSEVVDGRPNVVQLSAQTKSFLFDPIARAVTFRMKTNAGRSVNLHLPLGTTPTNGSHFIMFVWDVSQGAYLYVNDKSVSDGLE